MSKPTNPSPDAAGATVLPATGSDGQARAAARKALQDLPRTPTTLVDYHSAGRVLVIDDGTRGADAVRALAARLDCTLASVAGGERAQAGNAAIVNARVESVSGHLGEFSVVLDGAERPKHFDLVLDLRDPPVMAREVPPPGYFSPGGDARALARALEELPELTGQFQKPRFFNYNPDICAHGASGIDGCTRCVRACATEAIVSIGEKVEVDPHLCQGLGSCVSVCPSGAMSYAYPPLPDLLAAVRAMLHAYREAGGSRPVLLLHDGVSGRETLEGVGARLPEYVLPLELEEATSTGVETWLSALAYGAAGVVVLVGPGTAPRALASLEEQVAFAHAILSGMGHDPARVAAAAGGGAALEAAVAALPDVDERPTARFGAVDEKRTMVRMAVDHLFSQAPAPRRSAGLPDGAPFGEIKVDRDACTLCMACASVCPVSALSDGRDLPQLNFVEWNCVQCGLCEKACPEDAIRLSPRFVYDQRLRNDRRVLNEEEPFCCVSCGKPFATRSMMDRMSEKLKGHWMFQDADALRRLQMCEDCRVKDMFAREMDGGGPPRQ
jgi:ferredoxin